MFFCRISILDTDVNMIKWQLKDSDNYHVEAMITLEI